MPELQALLRCAKYSLAPNSLGYCGPANAEPILKGVILNPDENKIPQIKSILKKFSSLYPYLKLIADSNNLPVFDEEVIESYWIGNPLLENVPHNEFQALIRNEFSKPGMLPKPIAEEKAQNLPLSLKPHHSAHVLYINFITPKVEPILKNLSHCLVLPAEIKEPKKGTAIVKTYVLEHAHSEFQLRETIKKIQLDFFTKFQKSEPQKGDFLTTHWNQVIEPITNQEKKSLLSQTEKTIAALNT